MSLCVGMVETTPNYFELNFKEIRPVWSTKKHMVGRKIIMLIANDKDKHTA